ncbi:hypothetical protein DSUL_50467 [Desulfovibrionales bacterium]
MMVLALGNRLVVAGSNCSISVCEAFFDNILSILASDHFGRTELSRSLMMTMIIWTAVGAMTARLDITVHPDFIAIMKAAFMN